MIFLFEFVYMVDYVDGFPNMESSLNPMMVNDHFDVFLDFFRKNFISFASMFLGRLVLSSLSLQSLSMV